MSEEINDICRKCGMPIQSCTCEQRPSQVIEVKHTGFPSKLDSDPEKAQLKEKLEQRKMQLTTIVLKELEKEKKKLLSTIEDPKRRQYVDEFIGDDPQKLEQVKATIVMLGKSMEIGGIKIRDNNPEDTETPPPSGQARAPPSESQLLGSGVEQINRIYDTLEDKTKSEEEKRKARRKADELMNQFIAGRREAIKQDPRHRYYLSYSMCPKCLEPIFLRKGDKEAKSCSKCGAVLVQRK